MNVSMIKSTNVTTPLIRPFQCRPVSKNKNITHLWTTVVKFTFAYYVQFCVHP